MDHFKPLLKGISTKNRRLILIGVGVILAHVLLCSVVVMLGGNLNDVIRAQLGM